MPNSGLLKPVNEQIQNNYRNKYQIAIHTGLCGVVVAYTYVTAELELDPQT